MEIELSTTQKTDLVHPEDGQYIWLPLAVLVGVLILGGLVYAMSRMRGSLHCLNIKRRNATRNGYTNVEDGDSDVSMAGAGDYSERTSITHLLDARLQIPPQAPANWNQIQITAPDVALLT